MSTLTKKEIVELLGTQHFIGLYDTELRCRKTVMKKELDRLDDDSVTPYRKVDFSHLTVKGLKEILDQYPDDMLILYHLYSDYSAMIGDDIELKSAVPKDFYYMRSHETMSEENKNNQESFLVFPGN